MSQQMTVWDYGRIEPPDSDTAAIDAIDDLDELRAQLHSTSRQLYQAEQALGDYTTRYGRLRHIVLMDGWKTREELIDAVKELWI